MDIRIDRGFVASTGFGAFMGVGGYSFKAALLVSIVSGLAGAWMGQVGLVNNPVRSVEQWLMNTSASMGSWWIVSRAMPSPSPALPAGNPSPRRRQIRRTR